MLVGETQYRMKDLGQTCSGRRGSDDDITLQAGKFQIGDFIDVAREGPQFLLNKY